MLSWAAVVFSIKDEVAVARLPPRKCLPKIKGIYASVGRIYGYLSKTSHWEYVVHSIFLKIEKEKIGILKASAEYRAMSLTLCLLVLDVAVEVIRHIYKDDSKPLIIEIQGTWDKSDDREIHKIVADIMQLTSSADLELIGCLFS